jgi:hypothetical protein
MHGLLIWWRLSAWSRLSFEAQWLLYGSSERVACSAFMEPLFGRWRLISRSGNRLSSLGYFVVFLCVSKQVLWYWLKLFHQSFFTSSLPYSHSMLCSLNYWTGSLNKVQINLFIGRRILIFRNVVAFVTSSYIQIFVCKLNHLCKAQFGYLGT